MFSYNCSLQKIPQFPRASNTLPVFAKCDDFMTELAKRLNMEIPNFVLKRRAKVSTEKQDDGQLKVTVTGLDVDEDVPYSFIKVGLVMNHGAFTLRFIQHKLSCS